MGLGGDNAWRFGPLEKYRLSLGHYDSAFRLRPYASSEAPATLARVRLQAIAGGATTAFTQ